jgi:hypothetical protein
MITCMLVFNLVSLANNMQLASTCQDRFEWTQSFEGTPTLNLVSSMNDMRLASFSLFRLKLNMITCMLAFQFGFMQ